MVIRELRFAFRATAVLLALLASNQDLSVAADDPSHPAQPTADNDELVRVAAVQTKPRLIDWRVRDPQQVLAAVDENLVALEAIIDKAGEMNCDVLAFPEDTLGLLNWFGMNEQLAKEVLPTAVARMIDRLGRAAAAHEMYLVVCSDFTESDGATYNTAFFLDRAQAATARASSTFSVPLPSSSRVVPPQAGQRSDAGRRSPQ